MLLFSTNIYCYYLIYVVIADDNDIVRDIHSGQRHIPCRHVIFYIEYLTCESIDAEDEMKVESYIRTGCDSGDVVCESTEVKTCQPVVTLNTLSHKCFCRSLSDNDTDISNANLIPWQALSRHMRGFTYNRQISGGHPATEYSKKPLRFIISPYNLDDSVFTASSQLWNCPPYKARIDGKYTEYDEQYAEFDGWCSISRSITDWLQMDLQNKYVVRGALVQKRIIGHQHPTMISVKSSDDGNDWDSIITDLDIVSLYRPSSYGDVATVWFLQPGNKRYWRIYIKAYYGWSSMKCDMIGYPL